jgi:hypothetical protein
VYNVHFYERLVMNTSFTSRTWLRWTATFIGFPLAGLAARAVTGRIDSTTAALLGDLAAGVVLGAVQAVALSVGTAERLRWAAATGLGFSGGLAVGAGVVDFATGAGSLMMMGAVSGAAVGLAQAIVMRSSVVRRLVWAGSTSALWALGWFITSQVIDAERQWATFGSSGAVVVAALGGLVLSLHSRPFAAGSSTRSATGAVAAP